MPLRSKQRVVDPHILAARFYAPGPQINNVVLDKVIVRDFVLDCQIGIFSIEMGVTQRVRFSVELEVYPRVTPLDENIDNVISYDFVIDGIMALVAEGHTLLVETLAERIAAHCLSDRRAATVRVLAEKLDRVPGAALGVEIFRRQRAAHEANVYSLQTHIAGKAQQEQGCVD
jgi:dihydroneopterin aldolase